MSGKGAMTGLLVDDRFRPLTVGPGALPGVILIQETGDELASNENGEFASGPLEPGRYTLRVQITDHEAVPQTFQVRAGEVTELTVIARRVISTDDLVIAQEFAVFIPCMMGAVVTPIGACALMDLSGDTARYVFRMNITAFPNLQFMVTELLLNKDAGSLRDGTYMMQIEGPSQDGATSYNYVSKFIEEGAYDKTLLEKGVQNEYQQDPLLNHGVWEGGDWIGWRFWGQGLLRKDLNDAGAPVPYGVGPQLAMKATVLTTLFFATDRAEVEAYCGLCGDGID
jgi:hypothetical protein